MQFYLLGRLHEIGNGLPLDPTAAQRYYRLSAARGYQRARIDLARLTAKASRDSMSANAGTEMTSPSQTAVIASADAFAPQPAAPVTRSLEPAPAPAPAQRAGE